MEKRELKFKAWSPKANGFVKNCYPVSLVYGGVMQLSGVAVDGEEIEEDELILLQYTGLKDKRGVYIYEGDILRITDYPYLEASQQKDFSSPFYKNEKVIYEAPNFILGGWLNFDFDCDYEVIGNVFENPELLKK